MGITCQKLAQGICVEHLRASAHHETIKKRGPEMLSFLQNREVQIVANDKQDTQQMSGVAGHRNQTFANSLTRRQVTSGNE